MKFFKVLLVFYNLFFAFQADATPRRIRDIAEVEAMNTPELAQQLESEIRFFEPSDKDYTSSLHDYFLDKFNILETIGPFSHEALMDLRREFFEYHNAYRKLSHRLHYLQSLVPNQEEDELLLTELRLVQEFVQLQRRKLTDEQLLSEARQIKKEYDALGAEGDPIKKRELLERAFVLPELLSQASAQPMRYSSGHLGFAVISTVGGALFGLGSGLVYGILESNHPVLTTLGGGLLGTAGGIAYASHVLKQPQDVREFRKKAMKLEYFGEGWVPFRKRSNCTFLLASVLQK